jgi:GNAT superfamily N-acetyltransferase
MEADNAHEVVPLFDAYRQFYAQEADLEAARQFLTERLTKKESVIFLASVDSQAVGFAQLYPSFASLSMKRIWVLNDLFVSPDARGHGVGTALLQRCKQLGIETGARELALETMKSNVTAQHLYESQGWKRDEIFYRYNLPI